MTLSSEHLKKILQYGKKELCFYLAQNKQFTGLLRYQNIKLSLFFTLPMNEKESSGSVVRIPS